MLELVKYYLLSQHVFFEYLLFPKTTWYYKDTKEVLSESDFKGKNN